MNLKDRIVFFANLALTDTNTSMMAKLSNFELDDINQSLSLDLITMYPGNREKAEICISIPHFCIDINHIDTYLLLCDVIIYQKKVKDIIKMLSLSIDSVDKLSYGQTSSKITLHLTCTIKEIYHV